MSKGAGTEQARLWRVPDLGDLEVGTATFVTHQFVPHTHPNVLIAVVEEGIEGFSHRGADHTVPTGSLFVINAGEVHTGYPVGRQRCTYRMIHVPEASLQTAAADLAGRRQGTPYFPAPVVDDPALTAHLRELLGLLEQPAGTLERESHLLRALAPLITRHSQQRPAVQSLGREAQAVRRVRDYIEAHSADNLSLEQLAQLAGLNSFHLLRAFRQEYGLPPHAYCTQLRVTRAKDLLAQGESIAQVAFETGFVDQSHLNRHFKRRLGLTPGQYQQGLGRGAPRLGVPSR